MKLVICEKPSVAREFAKTLNIEDSNSKKGYLADNDHYITWCVGHLITMSYPEKYDERLASWSMDTLPFLPERYRYEVIENVKEQYKVVSYLLNKDDVTEIFYAGDAAREGEYIGRLIRMMAGVNKSAKEYRVWIDSQTEEEILRGMKEAKPLSEYDALSDAGFMRAIEDYLFGINLSRAYTLKYGRYLPENQQVIAVGRVMSCVLGMVVDRERLIRNTKEIPFYGLKALFRDHDMEAEWKADEASDFILDPSLCNRKRAFYQEERAKTLKTACEERGGVILNKKEKKLEKKEAPLLFNLAELQGECSSSLKISPDKTLEIVQSLYEKKMVTYPRTDARVLSSAVAKEIRTNLMGLQSLSGKEGFVSLILDQEWDKMISSTKYTDDSKVSDHYAIIPTGQNVYGSSNELERQVYDKIVNRFLSIFYPAAVYEKLSLTFKNGNETFILSETYLKKAGFLIIYDREADKTKEFERLESLQEGEDFSVNYYITEGKTSPPGRYTTGSMILAMENAGQLIEDEDLRAQIKGTGIGTSATRAEVIKKLITRKYISCNEKTQGITPTREGEIIYDIISCITPSLLNPKMTASWEKGLAGVEHKTVTKDHYHVQLRGYVKTEVEKIKNAEKTQEILESIAKINAQYGYKEDKESLLCPCCGRPLKKNAWGYGCSGYKDADPCKFNISNEIAGKKISEAQAKMLIKKGKTNLIEGFKSRSGSSFDAYLVVDKANKKISFEFLPRK